MLYICSEILFTSENELIRNVYFNVDKSHKHKVGKKKKKIIPRKYIQCVIIHIKVIKHLCVCIYKHICMYTLN